MCIPVHCSDTNHKRTGMLAATKHHKTSFIRVSVGIHIINPFSVMTCDEAKLANAILTC